MAGMFVGAAFGCPGASAKRYSPPAVMGTARGQGRTRRRVCLGIDLKPSRLRSSTLILCVLQALIYRDLTLKENWAGKAFRKFLPLFDRVLVERCAAETVTKGGIMIPEKAQGKVLQATVVAVGSGARGKNGEIQPVSVKVGEKVLLPEYGGTKIVLEDKDYYLFRDGDILGKYVD
ncbi:PREDICTED: 10 kDa heat shock protein, mitochondrial [Pterocles gutturalis]|uniref:10 kDa heat shock protein, mitochondrial n=1 Tax=Pterocles gutturalis TaxID=240206 RepID=UPI000528F31C|nr:PREDICTED: 10 kDa heat shock protein, mitochondrial [Pterocles gutturalis]